MEPDSKIREGVSLKKHRIAVVVLAAGLSSRMGGQHKLRLPLRDGRTVLEHAVDRAASWQPAQLVVVLQPEATDLAEALAGLPVQVVANPDYASGMSSSLRVAVSALSEQVAAVLVLLGDQPSIDGAIIASLLQAYEEEGRDITIPVYGDVAGPPTLFTRAVFPELVALSGDEGGRQVVRKDPSRVSRVALPAHSMPPDIDTVEDYARYMKQ